MSLFHMFIVQTNESIFSFLHIFGLSDDMIFIMIMFISIFVCYVVIRPFVSLVITMKSKALLNYMMTSLLYMVIFLSAVFFIDHIQPYFFKLLKLSFQALAILGCLLLFFRMYKQLMRRLKPDS
ncbi:hypothetical protein ACFFIS_12185 [Virgibacillus soli]